MWHSLRNGLRTLRYSRQQPVIVQDRGRLALGAVPLTFVVVVGPYFNQMIPNAGTSCLRGWCSAFEQLGVPYVYISLFDLAKRLPEIPNPLCWVSGSDYAFLSPTNFAALKRQRHVVWVNPWFDGDAQFYRKNDLENNSQPAKHNERILSSEPELVFTISPERSFAYYQNWLRRGARLASLPLACDTALYRRDAPFCPEFASVEMAFVGGYWRYKARQFDRYLKPYEDKLTVFGYSRWQYANYGGRLSEEKEPSLYRQARLSPTINEPQAEIMGVDLNERVFKILGSGGMTVTDVVPAYREWFSEEELLVPSNLDEFHDFVHHALTDDDFNARYRQTGYAAVMARHTYAHRARTLLNHLGMDALLKEDVSNK
jgi:hypothetical protein